MPSKTQTVSLNDPLLGARLGEYEVFGLLGEGGMGVVYKALQPVIKKRVAIKVLKPTAMGDPSLVNRLVAEAEAVNSIGHRNIIDIFGLGRLPDGRPYIVMEYLDGEPLDVYLRSTGKVELGDALALIDAICRPLGAAHRAGVIHRDLKPSNVFLCRQQDDGARYLKLLDFGLAKRSASLDGVTEQTSRAVIQGTPDFMAPEQVRGHAISPRTDIYALGVLFYRLVTGELPFVAPSPLEVMMLQINGKPQKPSKLEPSLPDDVSELIEKMIAKSPDSRPQTVEEVRQVVRVASARLGRSSNQLELATSDSAPELSRPLVTPGAFTAQMAAPTQVTFKPDRSRQLAIAVVAGLAVIALTLTGVVLSRRGDTPTQPVVVVEPPAPKPEPVAVTAPPPPSPVQKDVAPEPTPLPKPPEPAPVVRPVVKLSPAPTADALVKRIERLEAALKKATPAGEEPDPSALTFLRKYRLQAVASSTEAQRRDLARLLDSWEQTFLKK